MSSLNKVMLIGNLGADPEARSFQNGGEVVNLRIATTESWKGKDGNRNEKTEWHTVAIFSDGLCKVAKSYLRKGSKVYLEGQLETRKWQDQNGNDRYSTEIVLRNFNSAMVLLDNKGGGAQTDVPRSAPTDLEHDLADDVPFLACDPSLEHRVG